MYPNPPVSKKQWSIANGGTTSDAADLEHYSNNAVIWPTMTSATATFLVCSTPDGTFVQLVDDGGAAISVTISSGKGMALPPELSPWRWAKVVTSGAEGAARTIPLICKA